MVETLTSIITVLWFIAKFCLLVMLIELIPFAIGVWATCDNIIWIILCAIPMVLAAIVFFLSIIGFLILTLITSFF